MPDNVVYLSKYHKHTRSVIGELELNPVLPHLVTMVTQVDYRVYWAMLCYLDDLADYIYRDL